MNSIAIASGSAWPTSVRAWPAESLPRVDVVLNRLRQLQQADGVGDVAAAAADDMAERVLGVVEFLDQLAIAARFFDRVQIGALDVFDEGDFERLGVGEGADDDGHFMQARLLRRAPAPFAGDDLVLVGLARNGADNNRLEDAFFADRVGELVEQFGLEMFARLERVGTQERDRQRARRALVGRPTGRVALLACWGSCWRPAPRTRPRPRGPRGRDRVPRNAFSLPVSCCFPRLFALDEFARELDVGLASRAFQVVKQGRQTVRRGFGDAYVARYYRLVNFFAEMRAHVLGDLFGQVVALVVHCENHALNFQTRIETAAYQIDGAQQLA